MDYFTVPQVARQLGIPDWKARRAADALGDKVLRVGQYRAVPADLIPAIGKAAEKIRPRQLGLRGSTS